VVDEFAFVLAITINLFVVIRFFSVIEKRLTRIETIQEDVFRERLKLIEAQVSIIRAKCRTHETG